MPQPQSLDIRVKLTEDDYARFNQYHGRKSIAILFLCYWVLFVLIVQWKEGPGSLIWAVPAGLLLSAALVALHLWSIRVKTRTLYRNDKLSELEQSVRLSNDGILHTVGETSRTLPWDSVFRAAETKAAMILYLTRSQALLIPKRDAGDWPLLKDLLRRHLPSAKLRLKG